MTRRGTDAWAASTTDPTAMVSILAIVLAWAWVPPAPAASADGAVDLRYGTLLDAPGDPEYGQAPLGATADDRHLVDRFYSSQTLTRLQLAAATDPPSDGEPGEAAGGDGPAGMSADEAARQSSNPLGGNFWILLNQIDLAQYQGDATGKTRHINTWAFQPVMPIKMKSIGENWILVNRPTLPIVMRAEVPDGRRSANPRDNGLNPGGGSRPPSGFPPGDVPFTSESGIGDVQSFHLLGQSIPQKRWGGGDFVWGLGPTFEFPTATEDELGTDKWSIGPAGVLAFIGNEFIIGGLMQNWFSYAGKSSADDVKFSWLNLFYFKNFPGGWQVGGTPIITADWEQDSDDRWTVPLGLGVYKTHLFGKKMPVKFGIEAQYSVVRPDAYGQDWNIRFVVAPIIPSLLFKDGI